MGGFTLAAGVRNEWDATLDQHQKGSELKGYGSHTPSLPIPSPPPSSHFLTLPHTQLFNLIGLKTNGPTAVSKETVTLAHFLDVADAVVKNVDAIKSLDAQAQVCVCVCELRCGKSLDAQAQVCKGWILPSPYLSPISP